jgi:hypothetical protein
MRTSLAVGERQAPISESRCPDRASRAALVSDHERGAVGLRHGSQRILGRDTQCGMTGRVSAVVAGAAKDSPGPSVCEFVNISLCDVVKREA